MDALEKSESTSKRPIGLILCWVVFFVGSIALIRDTAYSGQDLAVFWRSARSLLNGEEVYLIARDGGMIFKYPPWIAPFFLPFGLLPLQSAKWLWGLIEVVSLGSVFFWLRKKNKVDLFPLFSIGLAYWGLWVVHALDGQVVLPILALVLWFWRPFPLDRFTFRTPLVALALSTKIFTLLPFVQEPLSKRWLRSVVQVGMIAALLSVPALICEKTHSPVSLFHHWAEAASSGAQLLTQGQTRGRTNPGLTGFFLNLCHVPASDSRYDVIVFLVLGAIFGTVWKTVSKNLSIRDQWLGWIALVPVVHPLPWWHLFIFTFPMTALVWDRAWKQRELRWIFLSGFGIILIAAGTEKLLGQVGFFLEDHAGKSWGTLICAYCMIHVREPRRS